MKGRPRAFDEDEVLDRALMAFWRLGYDACSVRDIVAATGVKAQSLYNVYGDKRGLFLAAAARYRARSAAALAPLRKEDAGVDDVRGYVEQFLKMLRANDCTACLLVRTALSPIAGDAAIRRAIDEASNEVRAALALAVGAAVRRGELPRTLDPKAGAAYLYTVLHGLTALAQTGGTPKQLKAALATALAGLARA